MVHCLEPLYVFFNATAQSFVHDATPPLYVGAGFVERIVFMSGINILNDFICQYFSL